MRTKLPTLAHAMKAGRMAFAIFGGRELTHAAQVYIYDAQVYFGVLEVEGALDGRELYVPEGVIVVTEPCGARREGVNPESRRQCERGYGHPGQCVFTVSL